MTTTPTGPSSTDSRRAFGQAVGGALALRDLTQRAIAETLGVKQPTISAWLSGESEPASAVVFELERALELPPGHLSRHLGYLPPDALEAAPPTFEAVVEADPLLDEPSKRGLLAMYRELTTRRTTSRGGRPKKSSS